MNEIFINIITHPAFGIVAGGTGFMLGHYFSIGRDRRNEFNAAAAKLRNAFWPILNAMNSAHYNLQGDLGYFLEQSFFDLKAAVFDFSHYLPAKTKAEFLEAWYEYYCREDARHKNSNPFFEQYSTMRLTPEQVDEKKKFVQSRIEKILNFARQK